MNILAKPRACSALPGRERGAVLILALLIVALVAGLGIKFAGDYQLGLARAEGRWHGAQARAYSFSGEGAAVRLLSEDHTNHDSLDEPWAQETPLPVEGGIITIHVTDANSQINIDSVARGSGKTPVLDPALPPSDPNRYTAEQRRFIRLLQLFPEMVPTASDAVAILEAMVDWKDMDDDPSGSNGAENNYYLGLRDPYYSSSKGLFVSIEELQMVRGITPQLMRALRPYITVAQGTSGKPAVLNVNTMLELPLLYRCINLSSELQPLAEATAASLMPTLEVPFKDFSEFETAANKVFSAPYDKDGLSVNSDLFWLKTQSEIGDQRRVARSLLERGSPLFKVIRREEVY